MSVTEQNKLPSAEQVQKLLNLELKDEQGKPVKFSTLVNDGSHTRVVTVFIRHFFCGFCEAYVAALAQDLPAKSLEAMTPPTKLVLIGCGDPSLITDYKERTSQDYEVYADPSRKTYDALNFVTTLSRGDHPDYVKGSFLSVVYSSLVTNLSAGTKALSGGKTSQNGGEVVWENGEVTFIHRMQNTSGHLSVPVLKEKLEKS